MQRTTRQEMRWAPGIARARRHSLIAAAAREPEANERGSSLIRRRLHYKGLQSLFLTKRKELWFYQLS